MFSRPTSQVIRSATSSPALVDGVARFGLQDGQTTDLFGPVPVRANLSARQAKDLRLLTSGTFGPPGTTSSASASLRLSLVNRLQRLTDTLGSTLFKLTWKEQATPSGRLFSLLRASARRTDDTEFSSWPTPMAGTPAQNGNNPAGSTDSSRKTVALVAGWTTPSARDWKDTGPIKDRADGTKRLDQLPRQAYLAHGITLNGSNAVMERPGQLNPDFSRWLMGYPTAWDGCAPTETPSSRKLPNLSSVPTLRAAARKTG